MLADGLVNKLDTTENFLLNTLAAAKEEHAHFKPNDDMFSLCEQVAHIAQTVDWFMKGMLDPKGFDMDFDAHIAKVKGTADLKNALDWLNRAFEQARQSIGQMDDEQLRERLPPGPIMGDVPRYIVIGALSDHTAHHRGSIAVYLRLLGIAPPMPYGP